jgi:PAS domain S-box-containing protein
VKQINMQTSELSTKPPEQPRPALSVLVVDDDEAMRRSVKRVLQLDGYRVEMVGNAAELRAAPDLDECFAILLDRKLPDADGSELLGELKLRAPQASILIVTGHADMDSTIQALRTGVHDYLIKPVEPETLRNRLKALAEIYQVRQELQRSERRMLFLVEHLPAGAVYIDGQQLFGNKSLERITGYSDGEIRTLDEWFSVLCQGHAQQCARVYRENRDAYFRKAFCFPILRKDGAPRVLEIAGYRYDHHEIWLVTDVTMLKDAQQRLVQSERLAAIGQMVTGLAHESRNALQRARGCLDLLELDLQDQPEQLDLTQRIRRSLNDLQHNYEEVQGYASPIIIERTEVALSALLQQSFEDVLCAFNDHSHQLRIIENVQHSKIRADAHRMKQLFRNIVENAIAASHGPCHLEAKIEEFERDQRSIQRVEIRDHGSGIDEQALPRIFEPFFTTKQSGTGLGMAICKRIVEAHDGHIEAENACDGGAILRFEIPLSHKSFP